MPAVSTIWRILSRRGFVTPQPQKRPRSSWKHFCAEQPNERWQADTTHWALADGTEVEILNIIDDHSRLDLGSDTRRTTLAPDVVTSFKKAFTRWGIPASVLTDNGAIFTARQRGEGRVALEIELGAPGREVQPLPALPPTNLRESRTLPPDPKKWLAAQRPATTLRMLQHQLDRFADYYNNQRPHRALHRKTPAQAYAARPPAAATGHPIPAHYRVRNDVIDRGGSITLRHNSKMHHIGLGTRRAGTKVTVLIDDLHVRVLARDTGEPIRDSTLDPSRDYQPRGLPPGPPKKQP